MKSFVSTTTDAMTDIHRIRNDRQLCERCGTGHNKQQPWVPTVTNVAARTIS